MTSSLLVDAALHTNTHRTYGSAQRKYLDYCNLYHYTALPASDTVLINFVAYLFEQGLKGTSIKVFLAAIRSLHIMHGLFPQVYSERLHLALKGAIRLSKPPNRKAPITFKILSELILLLENRHDSILLKAVMTLQAHNAMQCLLWGASATTDIL